MVPRIRIPNPKKLSGILSLSAAETLFYKHGVKPGHHIVIYGIHKSSRLLGRDLLKSKVASLYYVPLGIKIKKIWGTDHIQFITLNQSIKRKIPCDTLIICDTPQTSANKGSVRIVVANKKQFGYFTFPPVLLKKPLYELATIFINKEPYRVRMGIPVTSALWEMGFPRFIDAYYIKDRKKTHGSKIRTQKNLHLKIMK